MEEWKEYVFTDVATLTNGRAYLQPELQSAGKYKIVRVGNLSGGDNWYYSDMELPEEKYCNKGDLLYAWACSFGPYIWEGDKTIYHYHIWKVNVDPAFADKIFLYYYLKYYTPKWMGLTNGSVMVHITKGSLEKQIIHLPSIATQRQIASILSSLDDKIELNRRINEKLEAQAQALFKSWFIDFEPFRDGEFVESELGMIPKGWRVTSFRDVCCNITDGVHNTVKDDINGNYYLLSCKNIKGGIISIGDSERRIDKVTFEKLRRRTKLQKGDILLSSVGTIGEMVLLNEEPSNFEFQRSVAIIKPNLDLISSHFLYYSMRNQREEIIHSAHGAVQQCLFISDLANFVTIYPPFNDIQRFTDIVIEIHNKISNNQQESRRLATLRDTLLPRLMSGEIKVGDVTL